MARKQQTFIFLFIGITFISGAAARADAPNLLTYQGRLTESGSPVTATRYVNVALCDMLSGGNCYLTGSQGVAVSNGLFKSTFTVPGAVNLATANWFIEIRVSPDNSAFTTLVPREMLGSSPFALQASSAAALAAAPGVAGVTVSTSIFVTGKVGIGTTVPAYALDVQGDVRSTGIFIGNGAGLTNLPTAGGGVAKTGDFMTGQLTLIASTLTVGGNAFSVGGTTLVVQGGYVGIGMNSPSYPLEVANSIEMDAGSFYTGGTPRLDSLGNLSNITSAGIGTSSPSSALHVISPTTSANSVIIATGTAASQYLMVVSTTGRVGIGISNPAWTLDVENNSSARTVYGQNSTASGTAIYGLASGSSGNGVYGQSSGSSGNGVWGASANGVGVYGTGVTYGVYGSGASGVGAVATAPGGTAVSAVGGAAGLDFWGFGPTSYFSGNVGIGTSAPAYKLDVSGGGIFRSSLTVVAAGSTYSLVVATGALTSQYLMVVSTIGNFGIGQINPGAPLDVESNSAARSVYAVNTSVSGIGVYGLAPNSGFGVFGNASNGSGVYGQSSMGYGVSASAVGAGGTGIQAVGGSGGWDFYGLGPRSYHSGSVGIGTTVPASSLHVQSPVSTLNAVIIATGPATSQYLLVVTTAPTVGIGTSSPATALQVVGDIRVGVSGTNGCVQNFAGTALTGTCSSDLRLKTNIVPITGALDKLAGLRPVTYEMRPEVAPQKRFEPGAKSWGLIAQDVEKVLPELVELDRDGYKAVHYGPELQMLLIEAVKELKRENALLKARLDKLESKTEK